MASEVSIEKKTAILFTCHLGKVREKIEEIHHSTSGRRRNP
jgi:hypothetical protein